MMKFVDLSLSENSGSEDPARDFELEDRKPTGEEERRLWLAEAARGARVLVYDDPELALLLSREGFSTTLAEANPAAVPARLTRETPELRARTAVVDAEAARGGLEETFDTIILSDGLSHVVNPDRLIQSVYARLAPGGRLALAAPLGTSGVKRRVLRLADLAALASRIGRLERIETAEGYAHAVLVAEAAEAKASAEILLELAEAALLDAQTAWHRTLRRVESLSDRATAAEAAEARLRVAGLELEAALNSAGREIAARETALRAAREELAAQDAELRAAREKLEARSAAPEIAPPEKGAVGASLPEKTAPTAGKGKSQKRPSQPSAEGVAAAAPPEAAWTALARALEAWGRRPLHRRLRLRAAEFAEHCDAFARENTQDPVARMALAGLAAALEPRSERLECYRKRLREAGFSGGEPGSEPQRGKAAGKSAGSSPVALPPADAAALDALVARTRRRLWLRPPARRAAAMIRRGVALEEEGFAGARLRLAREAVAVRADAPSLRALFWAASRGGDFETAQEAFERMTALLEKSSNDAERALFAKIRDTPQAVAAVLLASGARRGAPAYEPVPKRTVYVLHSALPYASGAYARRAHAFARALAGQDFDMIGAARPGFPFDADASLKAAATAEEVELEEVRYVFTPEPRRQSMSGKPWGQYIERSTEALEATLRVRRPAMVMAGSAHLSAAPALAAARRLGLPFVYDVSAFWELSRAAREPAYDESPHYRLQRYIESLILRDADHVLVPTEAMRDEAVARGADRRRISLAPEGCESTRFAPRPRDAELAERLGLSAVEAVVGYVGAFTPYEGLEDLVEACGRLRQDGRAFHLLLVGDKEASGEGAGEIARRLQERAGMLGLADRLVLPGRVSEERITDHLALMDVVVFPRRPQPVCETTAPPRLLAAMAAGRAVLVSGVASAAETVRRDETGVIVPPGDPAALAVALGALLDDSARRARLGEAARRWVSTERSWSRTAEAVAPVLARLSSAEPAA